MVAIVSGNTLGLLGGSSATLGQQGMFGNAAIGRSNEQGYLNVSNGNIVMQQRDDFIAARGTDFDLVRTYNAQGAMGQHWKFGLNREVGAVTGTLNQVGSTVVRTAGDGSEALYRFDAARGLYLTTDGAGAHDSLAYDAASQRWTWQAGTGGAREVYDAQQYGRIIASSDDSGAGLSYFYDASTGLLSRVVNASGDTSWFDYTDGDLAQVRDVLASGEVVTRVRYAYDGQHRLVAVSTDLTPSDNNIDDGNVAVSRYSYDGDSERVAIVTQPDGSALSFTYALIDGGWRVASLTDGLGRRTELAYDSAANITRVTDALGAVTAYAYDTQGQLLSVTNPNGQQTRYAYDDHGNLIRRVDARGNTVEMEYDANGNQILQRDALGNTVTRTYEPVHNKLLTETIYQIPDPDGAGPEQPGKSQTSRYVYDDAGRLRFEISAEGRMTEHRYNADGQRITTVLFPEPIYQVFELADGEIPDEATVDNWLEWNDRSLSIRHDYEYDSRGLLASERSYEELGYYGKPLADSIIPTMRYTYDQTGRILQAIDGTNKVTSFVYDGLGRQLSATDSSGNVTLQSYEAGGSRVVTRLANGLSSTLVYNKGGDLTDRVEHGLSGEELARTSYAYDADGRLRMTTAPGGVRSYVLYDEAGRKAADITAAGVLTQYLHDADGRLAHTVAYATAVSAGAMASLVTPEEAPVPATLTQAGVLPISSANDQHEWHWYDAAGRLQKMVDASGVVSDYEYDGASRLVKTIVRATSIDPSALVTDSDIQHAMVAASPSDRSAHRVYDNDGLLILEVDPERYLTEYGYDGAGQQIFRLRYANQMTADAVLGMVRPARNKDDFLTSTVYDLRGLVIAEYDSKGFRITSYVYDAAEQLSEVIHYLPPPDTSPQIVITDNPDGGRTISKTVDGKTTVSVYDSRGMLVSETLPEKGLDASGTLQPVVNRYQYDDVGKLIRRIQAEGLAAQTTLEYVYDSSGRLVSVTDQHGNSTLTTYHEDGSKTVNQTVDGRTATSEYDSRGLLTLETLPDTGLDANGIWLPVVNRFSYNAAGKLEVKISSAGLLAQERTSYAYDDAGVLLESRTEGNGYWMVKDAQDRQIYWSNDTGTVIVTMYASDGRRTETQTDWWGTTVKTISAENRPIKWIMTYHTGEIGQYDFNGAGTLIRSFTTVDGRITQDSTFNDDGKIMRDFRSANGEINESLFHPNGKIAKSSRILNGVLVDESTFNEEGQIMRSYSSRGSEINESFFHPTGRLSKTVTWVNGVIIRENSYSEDGKQIRDYSSSNGVVHEVNYHPSGVPAHDIRTVNGEITDENTYGEDGKPIRFFRSANGEVTEYLYHPTGTLSHYIRILNAVTVDEYRINDAGIMLWSFSLDKSVTTERSFNDQTGKLEKQSRTVNGETTVEEFDERERLVKLTTKGGSTRYVYREDDLQVFSINDQGKVLQNVYDEEGRLQHTVLYANTIVVGDRPTVQEVIDRLLPSPQKDLVTDMRALVRDDRGWHMTLPLQSWGYDVGGNRTPYVDISGNSVDSYLNLSNGNMDIRQRDDLLVSRGINLEVVRSYQSQGAHAQRWTFGVSMSVGRVTGELNGAGSSVVRTAGDGSQSRYTYDSARGAYVTTDGAGAYQTLTYDAATQHWTWRAGDASRFEVYDAAQQGRITVSGDNNNNRLGYIYDASSGVLSRLESASGDATLLDYDNGDLIQVRDVLASGAVLTRVRYGYDAQHRLTSVTTDLTPDDNSVADGNVAVTSYTYDGSSERIASVTQADGTSLSFTYQQYGSEWRVASIMDGLGRLTRMEYNLAANTTRVTDALGAVSVYAYDEQGQLTGVTTPAGQQSSYAYDAQGNLVRSTDARGNATYMEYDANGNQVLQRDVMGNTVTRTFDPVTNAVLTETTYQIADPDGAGPGQPGRPQTVRYAYSTKGQLRFLISAQGRVTEYRYDANGQRITSIQYAAHALDVSALPATASLDKTAIAAWIASLADKSASMRQDYEYDLRGLLARTISYGAVDAAGNGIAATQTVQRHVYDQAGQLLQSVDGAGGVSSFVYDGQGRLLSSTDAQGNVTYRSYDAGGSRMTLRLANGLSTTSVYNKAGELTDVIQTGPSGEELGRTSYAYDADGRLRMTTGPTGQRSYVLYDEAGRKAADVTTGGALTQYRYDANNQLIRTVRYAHALSGAALASLVTADGSPLAATLEQSGIVPAETAQDQNEWRLYDEAGRLVKTVGAMGAVTEYVYDGVSKLVQTIARSTRLDLAAFMANPVAQQAVVVPSGDDRIIWRKYDPDGLLRFEVDGERYMTEYRYDNAGRQVSTVRFATQISATALATLTLPKAAPAADPHDIVTTTTYNAQGLVSTRIDGEGYVTNYVYDAAARLLETSSGTRLVAGQLIQPGALQRERFSYDVNGRRAGSTRFLDGGASETTSLSYDGVGNLVSTNRAGVVATSRYDVQGRLTGELSGRGSAALAVLGANPSAAQVEAVWREHGVHYAYDAAGRRTSQTDANGNRTVYVYDADGRLTHTVNALGEVRETVYNVLGETTAVVAYGARLAPAFLIGLTGGQATAELRSAMLMLANPSKDSRTSFTYLRNGALETSTDALGKVSIFGFNTFGEQVSRLTPIAAGVALLVETSYDHRGQVSSEVRDSGGINQRSVSRYDAFGRLVTAVDANQVSRSYAYDRNGRLLLATDGLQRTSATSYDAFGNVLTQTDPLGQTTHYSYTAFNRQISVTTPEGLVTVSSFDSQGRRITLRDAQGATTSYRYDFDGNLVGSTIAEGELDLSGIRIYDAAGRLTDSIDAAGRKVHYDYDAANRLLKRRVDPDGLNLQTVYQYDAKGQQLQVTDAAGVVTEFEYDLGGQVSKQTVDPQGLRLITQYTYDDAGRVRDVTSPADVVTRHVYDKLGRRTEQHVDVDGLNLTTVSAYDDKGNLVSSTDPNGRVTRYLYDANDRLVLVLDAEGGVRQTVYDANGNVVQTLAFAKRVSGLNGTETAQQILGIVVRDPAHDTSQFNRYDKDGRLAWSVDGTGAVVHIEYDGKAIRRTAYASRLGAAALAEVAAGGTPAPANAPGSDVVTYQLFDAAGRLVYSIDGIGAVTEQRYDGSGNVIARIAYATPMTVVLPLTQAGVAAQLRGLAVLARDARMVSNYDGAGRLVYSADAQGMVTQFSYDKGGNLTQQVVYATLLDMSLVEQGRLSSVARSAEDRISSFAYDAAGRQTHAVDALGGLTRRVYDKAGNMVRSTAYATLVTELVVRGAAPDAARFEQLVTVDALRDASINRVFDGANRLAYSVDALGYVSSNTYDANGNLTELARFDSAVATPGSSGAAMTAEQLKSALAAKGAQAVLESRRYDKAGRVLEQTRAAGTAAAGTIIYTYDALGNATSITNERGYATVQQFDQAGRKTMVSVPLEGTSVATTRTDYDAFGNAVKVTDPKGNAGYFYYDQQNRLVLQVNPLGHATATSYTTTGKPKTVTEYKTPLAGTWDAENRPRVTTAAGDAVTQLEYDRNDRLVKATDAEGATEVYGYDGLGNRSSYQNKLGGVTVYTHDARGAVLSETLPVKAPDAAGVLRPVVNRYHYDAFGNRDRSVEAEGLASQRTTTYGYDPNGRLVLQTGEALDLRDANGWQHRAPVQAWTYDARGNKTSYTDANGNITRWYYDAADRKSAELNGAGILSQWRYDAAGNMISSLVYSTPVTAPAGEVEPQAVNAAERRQTYYVYDQANRMIGTRVGNSEADAKLNGDAVLNVQWAVPVPGGSDVKTGVILTSRSYDALGNVIAESDGRGTITWSYYNAAGAKIAQVDGENYLTTWDYDAAGNVLRTYRYANRVSMAVNAANTLDALRTSAGTHVDDRVVESTYDRMNRLATQGTLNQVAYTLDANGALSGAGRATFVSLEYDGLGNVLKRTEANGEVTDTAYDLLGRQVRVEEAGFIDFEGVQVRPTTITDYDGLGNVLTSTRNGKTPQENRVTRYAYDAGGVLVGKSIDGIAGSFSYARDGVGNVTEVQVLNREADGSTRVDTTLIEYDAMNREVRRRSGSLNREGTLWSYGVTRDVAYNGFGELVQKGIQGGVAEFAEYDNLGRRWKTNAGDGSTKVYQFDQNGNAVILIQSSGADLRHMTLEQILEVNQSQGSSSDPLVIAAKAAGGIDITLSTYDKRNQLTDTYQATMQSAHNFVTNTPFLTQELGVNFTAGGLTVGPTRAEATGGVSYPAVTGSVGYANPGTAYFGISWIVEQRKGPFLDQYENQENSWISIPPGLVNGTGMLHVRIDGKEILEGPFSPDQTDLYWSSMWATRLTAGIQSSYVELLQEVQSGTTSSLVLLAATKMGSGGVGQVGFNLLEYRSFGNVGTAPVINIRNQPTSTSRLIFMRRQAGSGGPWTTYEAQRTYNEQGGAIAGWFHFNPTVYAASNGTVQSEPDHGSYDFQYIALSEDGTVLNAESGVYDSAQGNSVLAQSVQPLYGAGKTFLTADGSIFRPSGPFYLNITEQGRAQSMRIHYRAEGTNDAWRVAMLTAEPGMPGWFKMPIDGMAAQEFWFETYAGPNGTGAQINAPGGGRTSGTFSPYGATSPLQTVNTLPASVTFGNQPDSAARMSLVYSVDGGPSGRVELNKSGANSFVWNASDVAPDVLSSSYVVTYSYEAFDANGQRVNAAEGELGLGLNPIASTHRGLSRPATIAFTPPVPAAAELVLQYRTAGSTGAYTRVVLPRSGERFFWDVEQAGLRPASGSNVYEYSYTLLDASGNAVTGAKPTYDGTLEIRSDSSTSVNYSIWTISTKDAEATIHRQQSYNAFGEIKSETDGRNNVTDLYYDTVGQLTRKVAPMTTIALENGGAFSGRPETLYYYDASSQLIGVRDANGNLNTQSLLPGFASEGRISSEFHADGGVRKSGYDIFGDLRTSTDELGRVTSNTYDQGGRLITVTRPQRVAGTPGFKGDAPAIDRYTYDLLGNRTSHTNAAGEVERTTYDAEGRVTSTVSFAQREVKYTYTYDSTIKGAGNLQVGGWTKVTSIGGVRSSSDSTDYFGHLAGHVDLGGHSVVYSYDHAAHLIGQTSSAGQNITFEYYANGYLKRSIDRALQMESYFEYDKEGNRTRESYATLANGGQRTYYQLADIEYDELNRVTRFKEQEADISYTYDANGNRRRVRSEYNTVVNGSAAVQDYWYQYDSMNRFTITKGISAYGMVSNGSTGTTIAYDLAGQRIRATSANGTVEVYTYTGDGYLEDVTINGVLAARRENDLRGRVTGYTEYRNGGQLSHKETRFDADSRVLQERYTDNATSKTTVTDFDYGKADGAGGYTGVDQGVVTHTFQHAEGVSNTGVHTIYDYVWWDEAKQSKVQAQGINAGNPEAKRWASGFSDMQYDVNGHVMQMYAYEAGSMGAVTGSAATRSMSYISDQYGQVLRRNKTLGNGNLEVAQRFYYLNGHTIGDVSSEGPSTISYAEELAQRGVTPPGGFRGAVPVSSADFDQNYQPINSSYPGAAASAYTVRQGDTLASIARAVWGDESLWYVLADANGLVSNDVLIEGQVLTVPNKVSNFHNNASTFKVYNAGQAIGDTMPVLPPEPMPPPPPAKKGGCGVMGKLVMAVVAVAVVYVTAGAATNVAAAMLGETIAAGTAASATATVMGGAMAGALGSMASQVVGMAIGAQDGFNWKGVALGALGGAVSAGVMNTGMGPSFSSSTSAFARGVVQGGISSTITQGVAVATGLQHSFSWRGVAAGAIAAGVGAEVGNMIGQAQYGDGWQAFNGLQGAARDTALWSDLGKTMVRSAATGMASGVASSLVRGGSLSKNMPGIMQDVIVNTVGNAIGVGAQVAQTMAQGVATDAFGNSLGRPSVTSDDEKLALYGAGLRRASGADGTAGLDGSIPLEIDIKGSRSLRYVDGSSSYLSEGKLADGRLVFNHSNGYFVQDQDSYTGTFVAADMSSIGTTLSAEDYGYASKRLYNLSANYDTAGWWHDTKATIGGWFGITPNAVRTADMEQERWELRQITANYVGAHPEVWAPTFAAVDAAAYGPAGATAVMLTRNRNYEDRKYAYRLANAIDQGFQGFVSPYAAKQNIQALQFLGMQKVQPGGAMIVIRSGRAGPASDAIEYDNLKNNYRARDAGLPDIREPAKIYGLSMEEVVKRFEADGYALRNTQTKIKSVSEVFSIEGHPDIAKIQRTQDGSQHGGLYYKYTLHDGREYKVIDPIEYGPQGSPKPGKFFAPSGQEIYWNKGWHPVQ